jgi:hypothetical protein
MDIKLSVIVTYVTSVYDRFFGVGGSFPKIKIEMMQQMLAQKTYFYEGKLKRATAAAREREKEREREREREEEGDIIEQLPVGQLAKHANAAHSTFNRFLACLGHPWTDSRSETTETREGEELA